MSEGMEEVKMRQNKRRWHDLDEDYFGRTYGQRYNLLRNEKERLGAYADAHSFVKASNFYPDQRYGEAYGGNHKECQVMTLTSGEKPLITYQEKTLHEVSSWALRIIWLIIYFSFVSAFLYQAVELIKKFNRNEKIVDIELKFEAAPFPAITLCNLNPYKGSQSKNAKMVSKMLDAFEGAMHTAAEPGTAEKKAGKHRARRYLNSTAPPVSYAEDMLLRHYLHNVSKQAGARKRREGGGHHKVFFEVSYSECECLGGEEAECDAKKEDEPVSSDTLGWCMCAFDRHTDDAWPCFKSKAWSVKDCTTCNDEGICPQGPDAPEGGHAKCYCSTRFLHLLRPPGWGESVLK